MNVIRQFLSELNDIKCVTKKKDILSPDEDKVIGHAKSTECEYDENDVQHEQTPSTMNSGARGGFGAFY